jgi:pimeloyl-ACP methyl ester carboxylesterase
MAENPIAMAAPMNICFLIPLFALAALPLDDLPRKQIPTDEGHISYQVRRGPGPPLILIPGSFNDNRQWDEVVAGLDSNLTLVLVELRGHGQSWPPPANGSIEQFAQDVKRIADAEGLGKFYVGGHSIGGMVALEVGHAWPQSVLGILSVEGWTNHHAQRDAFGPRDQNTLTEEQEARRLAGRARATGKWTEEQRKAFAQIWHRWDGSEFLATTRIPILEIYGDRGRPRPTPEQLKIPLRDNIVMRWIPGASHSLPLQAPEALAGAMNRFIRNTEERRARHMFEVPAFDISRPDFAKLPRVDSTLNVIFRASEHEAGFNMHPYITRSGDRFWAMWSSNRIRDLQAGQHVKYATSEDGIRWSEPGMITPREDKENHRYFARGFWVRNGELYALAAHDEAVRPLFAPDLRLLGYRWNSNRNAWDAPFVIAQDTINNFPPRQLPSGEWLMSRRDHKMQTSMLIGGVREVTNWRVLELPHPENDARLDEPHWWTAADGTLVAAFRDGSNSRRLYRSLSLDQGTTWSAPLRTDFPDATAKFNVLRLSNGTYAMASNPNPSGARNVICLSLSPDGFVFRSMMILRDAPTMYRYSGKSPGYAGYHYPQLLEHGGFLHIIHSENMEDIKLLRIRIESLPDVQDGGHTDEKAPPTLNGDEGGLADRFR